MAWDQVRTFLRDPNGLVYVNPAKDYIQPFELPADKPNQTFVIPAGGRYGPIPFSARHDGPIEVFYVKVVVYEYDDPNWVPLTDYSIDWFLEHPGKRKQFSARNIPLIATAGDGGRPYVLPESIFIPAVQSLNATFYNNEAEDRKVELVFGGIKFYPNKAPDKIRKEVWGYADRRERTYAYWQTLDEDAVLTANQTGLLRFSTTPDDADLEVFKLTAESTGPFRCQIKDGQDDRALVGNKIHSSLLFGSHHPTAAGAGLGGSGGIFPARWATSWLVRRSVQVQFEFDDLAGVENTVKPVLGGRKISYVS